MQNRRNALKNTAFLKDSKNKSEFIILACMQDKCGYIEGSTDMRTSEIIRRTNETDIALTLSLDGGDIGISTGIGFFDHMLNSFAVHSGFGLTVKAIGDITVDGHHTVEDVGIVLGRAFNEAIGDKAGIKRFSSCFLPMDETLAFAAVDISGRPFLKYDAQMNWQMIGDYDASLTEEFFRALATNAGITMHVKLEYGKNTHHCVEAIYKAVAHAMRLACKQTGGEILSTKGVL